MILKISQDNFKVTDNQGKALTYGEANFNVSGFYKIEQAGVLRTGKSIYLPEPDNSLGAMEIQADFTNPAITEVVITVTGISSINNARWKLLINH